MKKIFSIIIFFSFIFFPLSLSASSCSFSDWADVADMVKGCIEDTTVVQTWDTSVESQGGFKDVIIGWVRNIAIILAFLAVLYFVVWAIELILSAWNEEKLKKWKDMMKWAVVWFLAIVSAGSIISLLIHYFYYQG